MPDGQLRKKDPTPSFKKGSDHDSEFLDLSASASGERTEMVSSENDNQQNQIREKFQEKARKSNLEDIKKTYSPKIPENPPKLDKKNLIRTSEILSGTFEPTS